MKKILLFVVSILVCFTLSAQKQAEIKSVTIQTNGTCEQCKKIMMDNIPQWVGVKSCTYSSATAKVTITFDAKKTSVEQLRTGISKLGYDADAVKADAAARAKLPKCCTATKAATCGSAGCGGGCGGHRH